MTEFNGSSRGEFKVDEGWLNPFNRFLTSAGFSGRGEILNGPASNFQSVKKGIKDVTFFFENEVFILRPYYSGEEDELRSLPNFVYKPEDFRLSWYSYPLRDSVMNKNVTKKQFMAFLHACKESLAGS